MTTFNKAKMRNTMKNLLADLDNEGTLIDCDGTVLCTPLAEMAASELDCYVPGRYPGEFDIPEEVFDLAVDVADWYERQNPSAD